MKEGKAKALKKLKIVRGQMDGVIKMLEEDRYCVDISTQLLAMIGQIKKANIDILNDHLKTCVTDAVRSNKEDGEEKINEIITVIDKYIK
ncbi:metal-sensing transcriptional repressor [Miniphocaeibacter massiliensis]|uniref:metal-sensing transcriptional repressor n=1 Tax=Miniphocaeibacter massiliensis TaxID=2041841 RepID=UPI000C0754E8|nr:metal-sensing transcriptional repressor [Miniphocaeibacter massiliensis]